MTTKNVKPKDEARIRLEEKLNDVKQKVQILHEAIVSASDNAIQKAEKTLMEKSRSKFMAQYSKTSQNLEVCLNQLILMADAICSVNGDASCSDSDVCSSEEIGSVIENASTYTETENDLQNTPQLHPSRKRKQSDTSEKKTISPTTGVKCEICDKFFASKLSLKNHIKTRHTPYEEWPYVCSLCPEGNRKRYSLSNRLKEHVEFKHLGRASCVCDICGKRFGRPNHKVRHAIHCAANLQRNNLPKEANVVSFVHTDINTEIMSPEQLDEDDCPDTGDDTFSEDKEINGQTLDDIECDVKEAISAVGMIREQVEVSTTSCD